MRSTSLNFNFDRTATASLPVGGSTETNVSDVEGLAKKIVDHGGKQRMPVREYYPGEKPYRMVYCEDSFGNLLEIYSHSYELTYSAGAYHGDSE